MYLLIKTQPLRVGLYKKGASLAEVAWRTVEGEEQRLPAVLAALLQDQALLVTDLTGCLVVQGAGSFSDTRAAVLVANTLAHTHGLPLLSVGESDFDEELGSSSAPRDCRAFISYTKLYLWRPSRCSWTRTTYHLSASERDEKRGIN